MIGIPNIGNTCFINSLLQCLFNDDKFRKYILSNKFKYKISKYDTIFVALKKIFIQLYEQDEVRNEMEVFCKELQVLGKEDIIAENISNFNIHNDASELLVYLLDILNDHSQLNYETPIKNKSEKIFFKNIKNKSIVSNLFKIQQLKQLQCQSCSNLYPLNFNNNINIWQLNISQHFINSLFDAIKYDSMTKIINSYNCEKCKETVEVKERTILSILPPTLIIQLLRFENNGSKITKNILIPFIISLDKFSYKLKNQIYELNSVCCHISSNHLFGHYFSIVKSDEKWFILDDNSVNEAEEEHVKNIILQHGYIFFYHKI